MRLGRRSIGPGQPPYELAAVGTHHGGDSQLGYRLIETAGAKGADAVVLARGALSERDFKSVLGHAGHVGLTALGVPESTADVHLLASLAVPGLRIPEADVADPAVVQAAARASCPIVLSTCSPELEAAGSVVEACRRVGAESLALLAPDTSIMETWAAALPGVLVGLLGDRGTSQENAAACLIEREHRLTDSSLSRRTRP
jgi:sialic acid synthase SpsE